ncbi:MAG: hypothetical protein ABSH06_05160 [Thermodesulfobacteriota bacterium]|jgi:hypothetical protein
MYQIAEYCEGLEGTLKGEFRLVHDGGSLSVVPANIKKLSTKQAQAFYEKHFPGRSWRVTIKEMNEWIEYKKEQRKKDKIG